MSKLAVAIITVAISCIGWWQLAKAAGGERCTKTSTSCYDTVQQKARTCVTTTCTYADGHTTTSVSVELENPQGGTGTGTKGKAAGAAPVAAPVGAARQK